MKVLLTAINSKYIHSNLAVKYLKAFTKDLKYECNIREFSVNDREERIVEEIIAERPDVIGFSCYIWNLDFVLRISNLIKRIDKRIEILFGGPEVSFDSEDFLKESQGDYLIEGEGEAAFRDFILYKLGRKSIESISGLYYKKILSDENIQVVYNGNRPLMNFNEVVFPYSYESDEEIGSKIVYYEASRGCPFNCKYCLSSTIHGVRFLDAERVIKELQFFIDKKVKLVKFVDRTFNCNSKFAMEIWSYIINTDTDTTFHFEISADILKSNEIELLKRSTNGKIQFEIGVQTTNNQVLENIDRRIKFEDIKEKVTDLREAKGIKKHLDLIAGLPGEDLNSFKNSFNDVYSLKPEELQLGFLKLLKGSKMREEATQWGITYSPYPPYEILKSRDISYDELIILKRVEEVVDKYYNSGKFNTVIKYFINIFEKPFDFYYELGMFFYEKGYLSRSISNADYYKVFLEFNSERLNNDNNFLAEVIKFDYLKYNKKKWLPDFLWRSWDKKVENVIKDRLLNEKQSINHDKIHIEKFRVDIFQFIQENNYVDGDRYYLFDLEDSSIIEDISYVIEE